MKKISKLLLGFFTLAVIMIMAKPVDTKADTNNYSYTLGQTVSGTIETEYGVFGVYPANTDTYTFTISKGIDATINCSWSKTTYNYPPRFELKSATSSIFSYEPCNGTFSAYLEPGTYQMKIYENPGNYSFCISDSKNYKLNGQNKTYGIDASTVYELTVPYSCSDKYANANISATSSNKKLVAIDSITNSGQKSVIKFTTGNTMGSAKLTVKINGGNTLTYTMKLTEADLYIAKSASKTLSKPIGAKKVNSYKTSNKKKVTVSKKGKIKGIADGRAKITMKVGSQKYVYNVVVTDYVKLGKSLYREIKDNVYNPDSLKIYNVYYGFYKGIVANQQIPVIFIDYGATNAYGAMVRGKYIGYYNDVHELKYFSVSNYKNIIKRKSMKASKIKK